MASLKEAYSLVDEDPDAAAQYANEVLRDEPDNAAALYLLGTVNARAERYGVALPAFERCVRLSPHRHEAWNNLGMVWQECHRFVESREAFKKAIALEPKPSYLANLGSAYLAEGNYTEAMRWCRKALEKEPDHDGAHTSLGFAQLATGDWANGWKGYEHCLGGRFRKEVKIGDEPKWDGSHVDRLFVYGEQGLGDEIMYASCLGDIPKDIDVTLECDARLEGLFKRSFPHFTVHGTRRKAKPWADRPFDAGVGMGTLPSLYRPSRESCPRVLYLIADPERRLQWRALFDSWGRKPVIGLCWTGGRPATQAKARAVGFDAFKPLLDSVDAHFVSLQYKDTDAPIRHIPRAVQSPDYDDTAAFVAECDLVVGIHTTVHHLAGALGVPSVSLVPERPMWNYAYGDSLPWYGHQVFHRQKRGEAWADCVKRLDIAPHLAHWKES